MSQASSFLGNYPGQYDYIESQEAAVTWGIQAQLKLWNANIDSTAADPTNSPTWRLRSGLIMGVIAASGTWTNYSATATNGSQVARGILLYGLRMQDVWSGVNTPKFYQMAIGGNVQTANLIGLDGQAQAQLTPAFTFDQSVQVGGYPSNLPRVTVAKTANYQILSTDNGTSFSNAGAAGTVTLTLPPNAPGLSFTFNAVVAQTLKVASTEGGNIVALNNAAANAVAFQTASQIIGGSMIVYSTESGLWIVQNVSAGGNTITVS